MALSDLGLGHTRDYHGSKPMSVLNVVILGALDAADRVGAITRRVAGRFDPPDHVATDQRRFLD